jgi:hypothetical protein
MGELTGTGRGWESDWELRLVDADVDAKGEPISDASLLWVVFIQSTVDIEEGTRNFVSSSTQSSGP